MKPRNTDPTGAMTLGNMRKKASVDSSPIATRTAVTMRL
jgi:hypothetical protein